MPSEGASESDEREDPGDQDRGEQDAEGEGGCRAHGSLTLTGGEVDPDGCAGVGILVERRHHDLVTIGHTEFVGG